MTTAELKNLSKEALISYILGYKRANESYAHTVEVYHEYLKSKDLLADYYKFEREYGVRKHDSK